MEDGTDDTELLLPKQHSRCHAFCGFWKIISYLGIVIGNEIYLGTLVHLNFSHDLGVFRKCIKVHNLFMICNIKQFKLERLGYCQDAKR